MNFEDDNVELNSILESPSHQTSTGRRSRGAIAADICEKEENDRLLGLTQWTTGDNKRFVPAAKTCKKLVPAAYEIQHSNSHGIYFEQIPVNIDGLVRFPQANTDRVLKEIQKFWDREHLFHEFNLSYKRGILMWGPAGSGKSCCIKFVMKDVIEDRQGIVVKFTNPKLFIEGMRILREIEPKTPVVVLMEDIDATIADYSESEVLNILDGVDKVERVVFLATTNYPELLGARIVNRPSRFDKRFKIGHPNAQSRMIYLNHVICDDKRAAIHNLTGEGSREQFIKEWCSANKVDLTKWVKDTEGFSIAHLKELFVAVVIQGDEYDDAIKTLRSMRDQIRHCDDDGGAMMGFNHSGRLRDEDYE